MFKMTWHSTMVQVGFHNSHIICKGNISDTAYQVTEVMLILEEQCGVFISQFSSIGCEGNGFVDF